MNAVFSHPVANNYNALEKQVHVQCGQFQAIIAQNKVGSILE